MVEMLNKNCSFSLQVLNDEQEATSKASFNSISISYAHQGA